MVKFLNEMNQEEQRSVREELDEETLAIYDLLRKGDLNQEEKEIVKKIAKETLTKLKAEKLKIERWCESTQIRAQVKTIINDNLIHLPLDRYEEKEVKDKSIVVYQHIYSNYYGGGASIYNSFAA